MFRDKKIFRKRISALYQAGKFCYYKDVYSEYKKKYDISKSFVFNGNGIKFYGDGKIICGDESYIGRCSSIQAHKDSKVVIGKKCAISHYIKIYTATWKADQDMSKKQKNIEISVC